MKMLSRGFLLILMVILSASCAKIFYAPDAYTLAHQHKVIAVLPPSVSIAANKKVDANALIEQQKTESLNFQKEIYSWLLKRKMQGKIQPEILDVETTNAKLKKAGYPENPLSPDDICSVLGVDGIMSSNFSLSKPMSEGSAIVLGLLVGFYGATNQVSVSLSVRDCANKKLLWNYDHTYSGGLGSTPSSLVDALMRKASKKMPYLEQSKN